MTCAECGREVDLLHRRCPTCGEDCTVDPDSRFKAAMAAVDADDIGRAIALLERCVEADPGHLNGRFNLGIALCMVDRCDEAIGHLFTVLMEDEDYPGIHTALGEAAFGSYLYHEDQARKKSEAMICLLRQAVERDEEDVDAHFSLGNAYLALDMPEAALAYLKNARTLDPESSAVHVMLARTYLMLGRRAMARRMLRRAAALAGPDDRYAEEMADLRAAVDAGTSPA